MIANHGRIDKYNHEIEGVNSRMDGIQGAVLSVKLKYLEQWTESRICNAHLYKASLSNTDKIITPFKKDNNRHVYHLYVIRSKDRNNLQNYLKENDIPTGIHYPIALPNLKAYRHLGYSRTDFPLSFQYQDEILSLPMYPELTKDMINYISTKIKDYFGN